MVEKYFLSVSPSSSLAASIHEWEKSLKTRTIIARSSISPRRIVTGYGKVRGSPTGFIEGIAPDSTHFVCPKSLASDSADGPGLRPAPEDSLARLIEVKPGRKVAPSGRDELPLVRVCFDTQRDALTFTDE